MTEKVTKIEVLWIGALIVIPELMLVGYWIFQIENWGLVLGMIFITNILFAFLTLRSLRQVKGSSEQLKVRAEKDNALLGSLGEGIVVTDKNGDVEMINKQAEEMIGWSLSEVVGKKWYEVAPLQNEKGELIAPEKRATQTVLLKGKPVYSSVNYYVRRDGSRFCVGTTASPVVVDEKTVGVIAVFRDITREREVDRAKTEFVSLASHQLRTPLSAIKWYAEMLVNGDAGVLTPEQLEFVRFMYQSNERMIDLVNALLNISRIELGRIRVEPVPTDLAEMVTQVLSDLEPKIVAKKLMPVVSVNPEIGKILVDPKLMRQVFLNLLSNAIKYTPEGGTVSVIISAKDEEIVTQVTDTGFGIPKDDQKKIFERFYRASNALKVEADGSGLGLYLVKAIVESSGGKVWFRSEENKGTTFWFTIPAGGTPAKDGDVSIDS